MASIYNIGNSTAVRSADLAEKKLYSELEKYIPGDLTIMKRIRNDIFSALCYSSCYSLLDYRSYMIESFKEYFANKGYYGGAYSQNLTYLEEAVYSIHKDMGNKLVLEVDSYGVMSKCYIRAAVFLITNELSFNDIDYEVREEFLLYIKEHCVVNEKYVSKYRKAFDDIYIRHSEEVAKRTFAEPELKYKEARIFLLQHPDPGIARSFWYTQDKNELLYDFTLEASDILKHQVFEMLSHVLKTRPYETINERKDRHDRFIAPLNFLYQFCVRNGIEDITQMMEWEDDLFISEMEKLGVTLGKRNMQILDNTKKYLFMKSERINWEANIWYMEKMNLDETRNNPATPVVRLKFDYIKDDDNRMLAKLYAKYLVGITDLAISNIRMMLYDVARLLEHCDEFQLSVKDLTEIDMDAFFQIIDYGIKIESYNSKVTNIYKFFEYLQSRGTVEKIPFRPEYYLKKVHPYHRDRIVVDEVIKQMLEVINYFPEHLRLMYFHLLCTGLRINEVCTLKGDAYFERNNDTWMRVYQNKMVSEKVIPIPAALYEMMTEYIKRKGIKKDEYIFKSASGGAYNSNTFRKQMIVCCTEHGVHCNNYIFRPHDYRHTIASSLFDSGTSLQSIREFLGHKTEEMTKQYIDYVPNKIDTANEEYFSEAGNLIRTEVTRKINMKIHLRDLPNYCEEDDAGRRQKIGNRVFDLARVTSPMLQKEFKSFILHRATELKMSSMTTDINYYNMVCAFLSGKEIVSILDQPWDDLEDEYKKWLFRNGYGMIIKRKKSYSDKVNTQEHPSIGYLRLFYNYISPESDLNEYDKDVWELKKLGIKLNDIKTRPVNTMNFSGIPQEQIKEETKRIAFMELGYKAVSSVVQDVAAVRRFAQYMEKEYPIVKSLTDLNREITEEYLIYMNTEAGRGKYQPKDVVLLREVMNIAGRMFECPKLKTVFLKSDVKKKRRTVYKCYSDTELERLNEEIVKLDKQIARALILHQLLGTRISDLLYLKQDCIERVDDKYVITIYQHKTEKSYKKPVNEDIKKLIDAASSYTNEKYGKCEYIFVDDKKPEKPMNAAKVAYHLRKMIYDNNLRDDNGELFTASTHIFRHNYGKKLVEMHISDEQIAKMLGHSGISTVDNYRRMSNETIAKETKPLRENLDKMLRSTVNKQKGE